MTAIDIERIRSAASHPSLAIETVAKVGSTNQLLMDASFGAAPAAPLLLAADEQTGGRGRRGRGWVMEAGRSVAFSIAIERVAQGVRPVVGLPIAVGVAAAGALCTLAPDVHLKWPNDLQRGRRKFGGILVESRRGPPGSPHVAPVERFVIGIGLNLLAPSDPEGRIGQAVTGLFEADVPVGPEAVIGRVAGAVLGAVPRFLSEGLAPFRQEWDRFDALHGQEIAVIQDGRIEATGIARGVDESGALRLQTATGLRVLTSGDISVRPLAP